MLLLATGLGVGYVPRGPGTAGSLWGMAIVAGLWGVRADPLTWTVVTVLLAMAGVPICGRAARLLRQSDPGCIVWDELAAVPVVFAFTPATGLHAVLGFVLFRLFDVWKPWPIRHAERLPGGWGVMADDLAAAVLAAVGLWLASLLSA